MPGSLPIVAVVKRIVRPGRIFEFDIAVEDASLRDDEFVSEMGAADEIAVDGTSGLKDEGRRIAPDFARRRGFPRKRHCPSALIELSK